MTNNNAQKILLWHLYFKDLFQHGLSSAERSPATYLLFIIIIICIQIHLFHNSLLHNSEPHASILFVYVFLCELEGSFQLKIFYLLAGLGSRQIFFRLRLRLLTFLSSGSGSGSCFFSSGSGSGSGSKEPKTPGSDRLRLLTIG